jgi:hypothetical protein
VDKRRNDFVKIKFWAKDYCPFCRLTQGVRSKKRSPRRTLTFRPQPQYQASQAAGGVKRRMYHSRSMIAAPESKERPRAAPESLSSAARAIRPARGRLGHPLRAIELNMLRLGEWLLETALGTRATCPRGNLYMQMRDELDTDPYRYGAQPYPSAARPRVRGTDPDI